MEIRNHAKQQKTEKIVKVERKEEKLILQFPSFLELQEINYQWSDHLYRLGKGVSGKEEKVDG